MMFDNCNMQSLLIIERSTWILHLILLTSIITPYANASIYNGGWPKLHNGAWKDLSYGLNSKRIHYKSFRSMDQITTLPETNPIPIILRGGESFTPANPIGKVPLDRIVAFLVRGVTVTVQRVLPPLVGVVKSVLLTYRLLPQDALIAQVGMVYCCCGGCYPTLFAAIQAARNCGAEPMIRAIRDLTDQAIVAVEATAEETASGHQDDDQRRQSAREIFFQTTRIVMRSVDPVKINNACSALYTSWLGVSAVLEHEFARTINYSLTLGTYLEPLMKTVIGPPVYLCVPKEYHLWVPVCLGWATKAIALQIAWRIQRVLTASTSAVLGGMMTSKALFRMLRRSGFPTFGPSTDEKASTVMGEFFGYLLAVAGLYIQLGDGKFDPRVKFPFSLLTWPFDIAERWIQWQITKK